MAGYLPLVVVFFVVAGAGCLSPVDDQSTDPIHILTQAKAEPASRTSIETICCPEQWTYEVVIEVLDQLGKPFDCACNVIVIVNTPTQTKALDGGFRTHQFVDGELRLAFEYEDMPDCPSSKNWNLTVGVRQYADDPRGDGLDHEAPDLKLLWPCSTS